MRPDKAKPIDNQFKLTVLTHPGKELVFIRKTQRQYDICVVTLPVRDNSPWWLTSRYWPSNQSGLLETMVPSSLHDARHFLGGLKDGHYGGTSFLGLPPIDHTHRAQGKTFSYCHLYLSCVDLLIKTDMRKYVLDPWWDSDRDEISIYFDATNDGSWI